MSDRGPDEVKSTIQSILAEFLDDDSPPKPIETSKPIEASMPDIIDPWQVAFSVPAKN